MIEWTNYRHLHILIKIRRKIFTLFLILRNLKNFMDIQMWRSVPEYQTISLFPTNFSPPRSGETLQLYVFISPSVISVDLCAERQTALHPIYYVSHVLQAVKTRYSPLEKHIFAHYCWPKAPILFPSSPHHYAHESIYSPVPAQIWRNRSNYAMGHSNSLNTTLLTPPASSSMPTHYPISSSNVQIQQTIHNRSSMMILRLIVGKYLHISNCKSKKDYNFLNL